MPKHGRIAFITTPKFREKSPRQVIKFVHENMHWLCENFEVITTGGTYKFIRSEIIEKSFDEISDSKVISHGKIIGKKNDYILWQNDLLGDIQGVNENIRGMIEITHQLVEGRIDAVIHLMDLEDIIGKPDSMVLRRQANVHNVTISCDISTAKTAIKSWKNLIRKSGQVFVTSEKKIISPLEGLSKNKKALALIAHNNKKLDLCCFFVEHKKQIFKSFDTILATGTTGYWIKKFAKASGISDDNLSKIKCCLSGPKGGDVQIASAVIKKFCRKVIFFQDPFTSHPHETDIRLFEQSVLLFKQALLSEGIEIELATNEESAKIIIY